MDSFSFSLKTFNDRGLAVLYDDLGAHSRGAFICPALSITPDIVNFITKQTAGLFYVSIPESRVDLLDLGESAPRSSLGRFAQQNRGLVSVEARTGVTTGISAFDRARTINVLGDIKTTAKDLISPGHVFPVSVREAGLLQKISIAEAAFQLCGPESLGSVWVEAINSAGNFHTAEELKNLCDVQDVPIPFILISDLLAYTIQETPIVEYVTDAKLPSTFSADFRAHIFHSCFQAGEHIALVLGAIDPDKPTLVRVQNESTVSDVFGTNASSRGLLRSALQTIAAHGSGILLYLKKPDVGSMKSEIEQLTSDASEDHSLGSLNGGTEMREYGIGAQILRALGVKKITLLSQSQKSLIGLERFGLEIVSQEKMYL